MLDQGSLVEIIKDEYLDRSTRDDGVVDQEELDGLQSLLDKVISKKDLTCDEYEWLCDLVETSTEMRVLEE